MRHEASVVVRACGFAAVAVLATASQVLAQGEGSQGPVAVPTLGGVGIVALAGAVSIGGAWLLRQRDKHK